MNTSNRPRRSLGYALGAVLGVATTLVAAEVWQAEAAPGDDDATFVAVTPCRLFDFRPAPDTVGPRDAPLGPGIDNVHVQQVTGANGNCVIPADAVGVAMNLTITDPTARSHLRVFPADAEVPLAATLNWLAGQGPTANQVDVQLSGDGAIGLFNLNGTVNMIADVVGYYSPASLRTLADRVGWGVIPSGTTVTGNVVYHADVVTNPFIGDHGVDLPGIAPIPLTQDDVKFGAPGWNDYDPTCSGVPDEPTAPPGKVCFYPMFTKNLNTSETVASVFQVALADQGFALTIVSDAEPGADVILRGSWAYTAP